MYEICYNKDTGELNKDLNISCIDQLRAYLVYARGLFTAYIHAFLIYRSVYQNYAQVLLHVLKNDYPIRAILRRGKLRILNNHMEAIFVTRTEYFGWKDYEIIDDKVVLSFFVLKENNTTKIEIYDGVENGALLDIFYHNVYDFLPADGKIVIDVGANIADSCIYFALCGAKKVIGLEPFPKNYEIAKKNIEKNSLTDKIKLQLAGCAGESGQITIDPMYDSNGASSLVEFEQGIEIPLYTLRDILNKNNVSPKEAALKMDCEGCEYETILSCADDTLRFFSHIQLEYHHGYKNLKDRLEKCGFVISVTNPIFEKSNKIHGNKKSITGYLYATRQGT